jgi:acetate---CoA ligase (ADP-forming)
MISLESLMNPRSVAVVGASAKSWYGQLVLRNLLACHYQGSIFPINPKYDEILGLRCFPSLAAIGQPVDCVVTAVARERILGVVQEASEAGARAAVIFASGFAEVGTDEGRALQAQLKGLADACGIRICGPNCLGLLNAQAGVAAYGGPNPHLIQRGGIGAVLQSGSNAIALAYSMVERGLGMSFLITAGNQVNVDVADYLEYLVDDPATRVIVSYIEGFKDAPRFVEVAAKAAQAGKPLVLLKVGRSQKAARAAVAHTGALVGADPVCEAVFRQTGVIRVADLDELVETAALLAAPRRPQGAGVGILTISGGETGIIADLGEELGLQFPDFAESTQQGLRQVLPAFVTIANPFDSTGAGVIERKMAPYAASLRLLTEDPHLDAVVISQDARACTLTAGKDINELFRDIAGVVAEAAPCTAKPLIVLAPASGQMDAVGEQTLRQAGVPLLRGLRPGLQAVSHAIHYAGFQAQRRSEVRERVAGAVDVARIRGQLAAQRGRTLPEHLAAPILAQYGLPLARSAVARDEHEVAALATQFAGPVVLKVLSPQIAHRSDVGGVVTGVVGAEPARAACRQLLAHVQRTRPEAAIEGILVQAQIPPGLEVIVGLARDPQFGPVLLCGLGGIYVEILRDVALRLPPLSRGDAVSMLQELKGYPLLAGARGGQPRDLEALVDVLLRVSDLATDLGDLVDELDINPLIALAAGQGVWAVDALLVLRKEV